MVAHKTVETDTSCCSKRGDHQAYRILRFAFTFLPIVAGLDKFFNFLVQWSQYLAPQFALFGRSTMLVVGVIEIVVGILVWIKPQIFSYVVALWLLAIIVNLLMLGQYYDIALRDFGLLLGALALGRLSCSHELCGK